MPENLIPRVILFDFYSTLVDIWTDEHQPELWDQMSLFLRYNGVRADREPLKGRFFALVTQAQRDSEHEHAEISVRDIFREILAELDHKEPEVYAKPVALLFRALSRKRFSLYPDTTLTLSALARRYPLGLVSDAQRIFLEPELEMVELDSFFQEKIVSSDYGFRKPDPRIFAEALQRFGVGAKDAVFVGNDLLRDAGGAIDAGLYAVLIDRSGELESSGDQPAPDRVFPSLHQLGKWLLS